MTRIDRGIGLWITRIKRITMGGIKRIFKGGFYAGGCNVPFDIRDITLVRIKALPFFTGEGFFFTSLLL